MDDRSTHELVKAIKKQTEVQEEATDVMRSLIEVMKAMAQELQESKDRGK